MSKKARPRSRETRQAPGAEAAPAPIRLTKSDLVLALVLLACAFLAYGPALHGKQLWDDDAHVTKPELRSADGLARIWSRLGATQQYYPLAHSVFWLEYRAWGESTLGYHVVNVLLHCGSAVLLMLILRALAIPGAWVAAAVFALHPVQVESVAWITELKNTLSGFFYFAAALAYLKYDRQRSERAYGLAILLFVLGLLSKSVVATLPAALLVVFWWRRGRIDWMRDVAPLVPFFLVGIAAGLFTASVEQRFIIGTEGSEYDLTLIERCLVAGRAFWFYLGKIVFPARLVFIYARWSVSQAVWWQYLFPAAALALAAGLWGIRRRSRAPLAALLFFSATLFPALGFFDVYPFRYSFVADHFQYLACIGPVALIAGGASGWRLLDGKRILALAIPVLLALGALTWRQSHEYADIETLFEATLRDNPGCWIAHTHLARSFAAAGRTDEAIDHFEKALALKPDNLGARNRLGILLADKGRLDEAIVHFRKAREIGPDDANTLNNLAIALAKKGELRDAYGLFQKALELARAQGDEALAKGIRERLSRFKPPERKRP
jgi:protein O-mannosyl-transferase